MMTLPVRIATLTGLVLAIAITLVSTLDALSFAKSRSEAQQALVGWTVREATMATEAGLGLGLSLVNAAEAVQPRLAAALESNAALRWIAIRDTAGHTQASVGRGVPQVWPEAWSNATASTVTSPTDPDLTVRMAPINGIAECEGTVLVAFDHGVVADESQAFVLRLLVLGVIAWLCASVLVALWIRRVGQAHLASLGRMEAALDDQQPTSGDSDLDEVLERVQQGAADGPGSRSSALTPRVSQPGMITLIGGIFRPSPKDDGKSFPGLVLLGASVVVLAVLLVVNAVAFVWYEAAMTPAIAARTAAAGRSLAGPVAKALDLGVPVERLRGVDQALKDILAADPDLGRAELVGPGVKVLSGSATSDCLTVAVPVAGHVGVEIRLGVNRDSIANRQTGTILDLIIIAVVTLLVTYELLSFTVTHAITNPLSRLRWAFSFGRGGDLRVVLPEGNDEQGRVARAWNRMLSRLRAAYPPGEEPGKMRLHGPPPADDPSRHLYRIRPPLFLLIFSEAISLSFLPLFSRSIASHGGHQPTAFEISLPITAFMVCWGLSQPFAGAWSDRVGRRRSMLVGMSLTVIGLVMTAFAQDLWQLVAWRAVSGVGYGIGFITATAYVQDHTTPADRSRGMAMFVWAFSAGTLCGSSIGGVLADRLGHQATFCLSDGLVTMGLLATAWCINEYRPPTVRPVLRPRDLVRLGRNGRFAALAVFAAIPPKFIITGINAFTLPIYLSGLGHSQAAIGRTLMAFNLTTIICSGLCAGWADRKGRHHTFVILGGVIAAIALAIAGTWQDSIGILLAVALLGVANGVGQAPLLALVPVATSSEAKELGAGTVMGVFRLVERIGSIVGPMVAGACLIALGFSGTMLGLAGLCLVTIAMFALTPVLQRAFSGVRS